MCLSVLHGVYTEMCVCGVTLGTERWGLDSCGRETGNVEGCEVSSHCVGTESVSVTTTPLSHRPTMYEPLEKGRERKREGRESIAETKTARELGQRYDLNFHNKTFFLCSHRLWVIGYYV